MFKYFDTELVNNQSVVDVWKNIDFSKIKASTDYNFHTLNAQENLMDLAFKYYGTINDWWCIYIFNDLYDINFCILQEATITNTQNEYSYNVQNYTSITKIKQQYIEYILREYYLVENDFEEAIRLTADRLSTAEKRNDVDFIDSFRVYIYDYLINQSSYRVQIKIPSQMVVYSMKTLLDKYEVQWKSK